MPHSFMHISIHYLMYIIYVYIQHILQTYLYYPSRLIFEHPNALKGSFGLTLGVWDGALKFAPFAQHALTKASRFWVRSLIIGMNPSKFPCIQEGLAWIDDSQYISTFNWWFTSLIKWLMTPWWGYKKKRSNFPPSYQGLGYSKWVWVWKELFGKTPVSDWCKKRMEAIIALTLLSTLIALRVHVEPTSKVFLYSNFGCSDWNFCLAVTCEASNQTVFFAQNRMRSDFELPGSCHAAGPLSMWTSSVQIYKGLVEPKGPVVRIIYIILDINPADFLFTFFPLEPNVVGARSKSFDLFDLQLANWSKKRPLTSNTYSIWSKKRPQLLSNSTSKQNSATKLAAHAPNKTNYGALWNHCTDHLWNDQFPQKTYWSFVKWSLSKKTALIICKWSLSKKNGTDHL